jgi:cytochrome c oxidase assembly protein subunit 16
MMAGAKQRLIKLPKLVRHTASSGLATPVMGVFDSKPLNTTSLNGKMRRSPLLFGVPFVLIMVVASYALVPFTQTKYELQDRRISKVRPKPSVSTTQMPNPTRNFEVTKEQELGLENRKRKFDIREEYFASVPFLPLCPDLSDLPPVNRNSARRPPKTGNQSASNVLSEHPNGVCRHLNLHGSSRDPL